VGGVEPREFDDFEFSRLSMFDEELVLLHTVHKHIRIKDTQIDCYPAVCSHRSLMAPFTGAAKLDPGPTAPGARKRPSITQ